MVSRCLWESQLWSHPFQQYITFELTLAETLSDNPTELHIPEERYLGKFSAHVRENIHIIQFTRPDIMYSVNRLSSHASATSSPAFQGIKDLVHYISVCPEHPIIYAAGLDGNTNHDLRKDVSPGRFHSQNKSNDLVDF